MPEQPHPEQPSSAERVAPNLPDTHEPQHTPAPDGKGPVLLAAGQRPVPDYQLLARLGGGGFGEVWKAAGPGGIKVALKFIRLDTKAGAFEQRALDVLQEIRHPNLLDVYGAWQRDGMLILAMQLGDKTLYDRLHEVQATGKQGIPYEELLDCLRDAARGLDHLNGLGIQHRDIKPHNLLLVGGGVKVADFGLAKLLHNTVTSNTGALTIAYAVPEFFNSQTSNRSDQYSLAVTYCQLRGGKLPFEGPPTAIMAGHVMHPPDLTMLPEAERPAVGRALAKKPEERWPNCRAFVEALAASRTAAAGRPEQEPRRPRPRTTTPPTGGAGIAAGPKRQAGMPAPQKPRPATQPKSRRPAEAQPPWLEDVIPTAEPVHRSLRTDPLDGRGPSRWRRLPPAAVLGAVLSLLAVFVLAFGAWWWFGKGPADTGGSLTKSLAQQPAETGRVAEGRPPEPKPKEEPQPVKPEPKKDEKPAEPKPPPPATLTLLPVADLTLEPGESKTVELQIRATGRPGPVNFTLQGLPDGVMAERVQPPAGGGLPRYCLTADFRAKDSASQATILARADALSSEARFSVTVKAFVNSLGMRFVLIPAGKFRMGSPDTDKEAGPDEKPQHDVEITQPFYLGQHEVTRGQFRRFVEASSGFKTEAEKDGQGGWGYNKQTRKWEGRKPEYTWRNAGYDQTDEHPVSNVTWNDAQRFCAWLGEQEGKKYRLPTEAEWEYSCRAQTTTRYHSGDDAETLVEFANVADASAKEVFTSWDTIKAKDGYVFTAPVGSFKPNGFGLFDMHGNVWEWCEDWFDDKYYKSSPSPDPRGPAAGSFRVIRGGSFRYSPRSVRAAYRYGYDPADRGGIIGFRVVRVR